MADQTRKQSLTNEIQAARAQIGGFVDVVRKDLDVGARLKSHYSRNPVTWFSVATVLGLLLSGILVPRHKVVAKLPKGWNHTVEKTSKMGMAASALKFLFAIAQPAVVGFIRKRIESRNETSNR